VRKHSLALALLLTLPAAAAGGELDTTNRIVDQAYNHGQVLQIGRAHV